VQNLNDWSFTINGAVNTKWQMNVAPSGNVTFSKKGLIIVVK